MKRLGLTLFALAVVGCQHQASHIHYPPKYPRAVPTAIDPALQAKASAELAAALSSDDEVVRCHGVEVVKDTIPADTQNRLATALGDQSMLVRKAACLAVGELKLKALQSRLDGPLKDLEQLPPEAGVEQHVEATQERIAAIFAQTACGDYAHSHDLEEYVTDPNPLIRRDALVVFGLLGNRTALPILSKVLANDLDKRVRLQAAESMWRLGSESGEKALITATISSEPSLQIQAILALAMPRDTRLLGNVMGHVGDDAPDEYFEVGLQAARACGLLESDIGYGVALKGADSVDPRQRQLAAYAFAAVGRPDDQPVLAKLLGDKDQTVRIAAARAILMLPRQPG